MLKVISFLLLFVSISAVGQDIHLSQFYASDHLLSPAKIGDFEGDFRVTGNYRHQWKQIDIPIKKAITTSIISFDKAFHYHSHEIDAGILVAHDEFAGIGFSTDKILLSAGYAYSLEGHNLRAGIQTGIVFRGSDLSKQTFPNQWDYQSGSFDIGADNQEINLSPSLTYVDFNIGVQWSKQYGKIKPKAGIALNHLNRPKDTYFQQHQERLRVRKVVYGEVEYYLSSKITIQPKLLLMWTTKANDAIIGSNVRYKINNKIIPAIFGGVFYRDGFATNKDALYPVIGVNYNNMLDVGISYDFNISTLSENVDRKGTLEVSIIYTAPSSKPTRLTIPCERY